MKALCAALLLVGTSWAPAVAQTGSPEQSYLAARDAAIAKLAAIDLSGPDAKRATTLEQTARRDLEKRLRAIIGKPALKGVSGDGKLNIESLMKDEVGFGGLDALAYTSKDDKTRIVVSTETLTTGWLVAHRNWWENQENPPQDIPAALKSEPFYTQAISAGAAVAIYAELPVANSANAGIAAALLVTRRQDIGPSVPDEILASAVKNGRVYIVSLNVEGKAKEIPACSQIFNDAQKQSEALLESYRASDLKDEKLADKAFKKQEEGDLGMRKCYAERVKGERYFVELTRTAQALLDGLPER